MVNENHFQFDCKSFLNFCKSFFEIKLFALARTFNIQLLESDNSLSSESSKRWNSATSGHRNPADAGIQRHPITVARVGGPDSNHGQKPTRSGQNGRDPARFDRIRPFFWPDLVNMAEIRPLIRPDLAKMAGIRRGPAGIRQF